MYKIFNKYVLRAPLLPIGYFLDITKNDCVSYQALMEEFKKPLIKEAIFLASPVLCAELEKFSKNLITSEKDKKRISNSFLKYLSRISSRPTPFGLFSGSSLGSFSSSESVIINSASNTRNTRLDMDLSGILISNIENISEIKCQLQYYANTSLYRIGKQLRYIESKHVNSKLSYQLVEIENSEYIEAIISSSRDGIKLSELKKLIVAMEIDEDEAESFISELIESQILTSELKQTVSGEESLDHMLKVLKNINIGDEIAEKFTALKICLSGLDSSFGNSVADYEKIITILKSFEINFNEKFVFQVDMSLGTAENFVNSERLSNVSEALDVLNKISPYSENFDLSNFKKQFINRYEEREMPLALVLDGEVGIGYPANSGRKDVNPLIDDLYINEMRQHEQSASRQSPIRGILLQKIIESLKTGSHCIELLDEDLKGLESDWRNLPDTFSALTQFVEVDGERKIMLNSTFASSAGNMLGRFCHGNEQIHNYVKEIVEGEKSLNPDKIIAEIVHLPEDRIGNILMRPTFRSYEIPYLSSSRIDNDKQIGIDDLVVSVKNDRLIIRSKKHGTQILPRLTTAHNFTGSKLPIYRFLCDMQFEGKRRSLRFDWNGINNEFSFLPRVAYKSIILSTAKWILNKSMLNDLSKIEFDDNFKINIRSWLDRYSLPDLAYLVEGDNKLLVNFINTSSLGTLLSEIKNRNSLFIEEFLFGGDAFAQENSNGKYVNELIVSFFKS